MAIPIVKIRKIKRKNSFVYQLDYTILGIRKREVVGSNKNTAELIKSKIQTDIALGKYELLPTNGIISFNKLSDEYLQLKRNSLRESSVKRYDEYLKQFKYFFKKYFPSALKDISLIKSIHIAESIEHLITKGTQEGRLWSDSTANGYRAILASIFKHACKQDYLKKNPVSVISEKKIMKKSTVGYYTNKEIDKIFENSEKKWKAFYNFILNTGLRSGEIINLAWENVEIDSSEPMIYIREYEDWKPKTYEERMIPINDYALEILKKQKMNNSKYVFCRDDGNRYQKNHPYSVLKTKLKKINVLGDIHKFRHTFATIFISSKSGTIYDLKELMGHSSIETTQIYAHLSNDYLREALMKLER